MKKYIFILLCFFCYISGIITQVNSVSLEKIDLNLQENELGITFLSLSDSKSLLLEINHKTVLLILDYLDDKSLNNKLDFLSHSKIDYIITVSETPNLENAIVLKDKFSFENVMIQNGIFSYIEYQNKKLCFFDKQISYLSECDYSYFLNLNHKIKQYPKNELFIYETNIDKEYIEDNYLKWIDQVILREDTFFVLKWKEESYETLNIAY